MFVNGVFDRPVHRFHTVEHPLVDPDSCLFVVAEGDIQPDLGLDRTPCRLTSKLLEFSSNGEGHGT